MKNRKLRRLLLAALLLNVVAASAQYSFQDSSLPVDERVDNLISQMTLSEKISQLGRNSAAISRLGVAKYNYWNEALHGVARSGVATSFPQSIAMSSTWNPELIYEVASVISDEARVYNNTQGKGLVYWCPTINMSRDPRWGRAEENYGEDVLLTSVLAANYIKGMQGDDPKYLKTISTAKHYAANNTERGRTSTSSNMDERSLREYYLPAFKACVTDGGVASVMSAYNAVNGVPCSASRMLLENILRKEWGFDGFVVSDCDAVSNVWDAHHYVATAAEATALSLINGTDLNCGTTYSENAAAAIDNGLMTEADIDLALKRIFKARFLLGEFDPASSVSYKSIPSSKLDCQEHRDLALRAAHETIVLLKNNDSFLPLKKDEVKSIAVIGPNANSLMLGGYSGTPGQSSTPLQGIADKLGVDISIGVIEAESFSSQSGLRTESGNGTGGNIGYADDGDWCIYDSIDFKNGKTKFDVNVSNKNNASTLSVYLDNINGKLIGTYNIPAYGDWSKYNTLSFDIDSVAGIHSVCFKFNGPSGYLFNVDWFRFYNLTDVDPTSGDGPICYAQGCTVSGAAVQSEIDAAVEMARKCDVAVLVCGTDLNEADESNDRESINLPGAQQKLLEAVYAANPKTVLVLVNNASLAVTWAQENVPAILSTWYNGQDQGKALADVLFGDFNPKGKLTTTWYKSLSDQPSMSDYNVMNNRTYMYFTGTPLYCFGHGLSYTTFEYSNMAITGGSLAVGDSIIITADIKNTGSVAGSEVVQLYAHVESSLVKRPIKELKGFQTVSLEPGETKSVSIVLKHENLSYYDENDKAFVVESGKVTLMLGSSSGDIRLNGQIDVTGGTVALTYRQDPYSRMEAEYYEGNNSTVKISACEGGRCAAMTGNGSYMLFKNFDFTNEAKQVNINLAAAAASTIEVWLDSLDGDLVGTMNVVPTLGLTDYKVQSCQLTRTTGIRDVYFVVKGSAAVNVDWLLFQQTVGEYTGTNKATGGIFDVEVYPNPASQNFNLRYQLADEADVNVEIYTSMGSQITSMALGRHGAGSYTENLAIGSLVPNDGLYLVKFRANDHMKTVALEVKR